MCPCTHRTRSHLSTMNWLKTPSKQHSNYSTRQPLPDYTTCTPRPKSPRSSLPAHAHRKRQVLDLNSKKSYANYKHCGVSVHKHAKKRWLSLDKHENCQGGDCLYINVNCRIGGCLCRYYANCKTCGGRPTLQTHSAHRQHFYVFYLGDGLY